MSVNPKLTDAEWHPIAAHLRTPLTGRPHIDVRGDIARLLQAQALERPLQALFGRKASARPIVKRARWREAGVWTEIERAGQPAMERMRAKEHRILARDPLVRLGLM
jgi:transposase